MDDTYAYIYIFIVMNADLSIFPMSSHMHQSIFNFLNHWLRFFRLIMIEAYILIIFIQSLLIIDLSGLPFRDN